MLVVRVLTDATASRAAHPDHDGIDVVVIGAGFAGLYAVHRLRDAGFAVLGIEAAGGVGGTWYWNRYPGARCDCEAMYYSYSFLPEMEQEWPLEERFPPQPKILAYLDAVADRLDLRRSFRFGTKVIGIRRDEASDRWIVRTDAGDEWAARYVVTASGCLSDVNLPDIPGASTFTGPIYHTARWPQQSVDFAGQRVGVIGTGSSGIQVIPEIAKEAARLVVFQRTPQFTVPARNRPLDPQFVAAWKTNYREWRRRGAHSLGGVPYPAVERYALAATAQEREAVYQWAWQEGGFAFRLRAFNDILTDLAANKTAAEFVHRKIDEIVEDPIVADMLKPRTYPFGTKRLPLDNGYYATFNRPNVKLVDLRRTPIESMTSSGIQTSAEQIDLDMLVCATGFDAITGAILAMDIRGRGGRKLSDVWAEGPKSYLGLAVPGFPNLFTITGPGSPSVNSNMPVSIEQHVDWIVDCLEYLRAHRIDQIEAEEPTTLAWTEHVREVAQATLFPTAPSWYTGANIAGKPRVFLSYLGGVEPYRQRCDEVAAAGYSGFNLR
jgi:cation diffusion facilitator CzcD-associated flavoprotein CzcO